jgi:hypothetical protein
MPRAVTICKDGDHLAMDAVDLIVKSRLSVAMVNAVERFILPDAATTGAET